MRQQAFNWITRSSRTDPGFVRNQIYDYPTRFRLFSTRRRGNEEIFLKREAFSGQQNQFITNIIPGDPGSFAHFHHPCNIHKCHNSRGLGCFLDGGRRFVGGGCSAEIAAPIDAPFNAPQQRTARTVAYTCGCPLSQVFRLDSSNGARTTPVSLTSLAGYAPFSCQSLG